MAAIQCQTCGEVWVTRDEALLLACMTCVGKAFLVIPGEKKLENAKQQFERFWEKKEFPTHEPILAAL